ncbi:hypothetical protein EWM64_g7607 [Hericium alpestre]|uniref:Uncharacterized protein n=1 Tax=Hericium alpestre TaxID=135208 RepID=A0A4Y9ZQ65_9AGAM|nr:hypothetical protein EWM64_g7607 [Hericium alpestre]
MFPITNIHVKDDYETSIEFFALRTQIPPLQGCSSGDRAGINDPESREQYLTPVPIRSDKLTRGRASRRRKTDAGQSAERRPASNGTNNSPQARPEPPASVIASVRSELEITRNELSRSQADAVKLAERCRMLDRMLKETTEALRTREKEVDDLKKEKEQLVADHQSRGQSHDRERRLRPETRRQQEMGSMDTRHDPYVNGRGHDDSTQRKRRSYPGRRPKSTPPAPRSSVVVAEENYAPVKDLETFFTKTDSWSGAQVIEAVQDLNTEILQLAAAGTELSTVDKQAKLPKARIAQATKEIASGLGQTFARILATRDHSQDPSLIQFGLQAIIAMHTTRLLSAFCAGLPAGANDLLAQVYYRMHSIEPQATSSRWRALTLNHLRALHPRLEEQTVNDFVDTIARVCADIFALCCCKSADVALTSKEAVKERFGDQARHIAQAASKLGHIVKEETMSTSFEVVLVEQAKTFDPATMSNAYAGYDAAGGAVLCTTELGLRCSTRKTDKVLPLAGGGEAIERTTLLQPKVILESVAQLLDHTSEADA